MSELTYEEVANQIRKGRIMDYCSNCQGNGIMWDGYRYNKDIPCPVCSESSKVISNKGALPQEPCRFCHKIGGVYFIIDDSPFGKSTVQVVSCNLCKATWEAHSTGVG
jgi:hypothetical protein